MNSLKAYIVELEPGIDLIYVFFIISKNLLSRAIHFVNYVYVVNFDNAIIFTTKSLSQFVFSLSKLLLLLFDGHFSFDRSSSYEILRLRHQSSVISFITRNIHCRSVSLIALTFHVLSRLYYIRLSQIKSSNIPISKINNF